MEDFDRFSRHALASRAVRALVPPGSLVLDVGGSQGFTRDLLSDYRVVLTDVAGDVDVHASVADLPFEDREFSAVVALDLLEHIPESLRGRAIEEILRVADDVVVIAGPFHSQELVAAEERLRQYYLNLTGRPHRWLTEHADFGLPDIEEVQRAIERDAWKVSVHSSNPLEFWEHLQRLNFIAATMMGASDVAKEVHEELGRKFLDVGDGAEPAYRRILVCSRHHVPSVSLRLPSQNGLDHLGAVELVNSGIARALRSAAEESQRLKRLEGQLREAMHAARAEAHSAKLEVLRASKQMESLEASRVELRASQERLSREVERARDELKTRHAELVSVRQEADRVRVALQETSESLEATREQNQRLQEANAHLRKSARRLALVAGRAARRAELKADQIEASTTWRIGRAALWPARILRPETRSGIDGVRREMRRLETAVLEFHSEPDREALELTRRIYRDVYSLLSSRRLRIGNVVVNVLRLGLPSRSSKLRSDRRIRHLADALLIEIDSEKRSQLLVQMVRAVDALESSRRYRTGSAILDKLPSRIKRKGTPASDRIRQSVADLLRSHDPQKTGRPKPYTEKFDDLIWGLSYEADRELRNQLYREYIENVEPLDVDTAEKRDSSLPRVSAVVLGSYDSPGHSAEDLSRTLSSLQRAGLTPVLVGVPAALSLHDKLATGKPIVAKDLPLALEQARAADYVVFLYVGDEVSARLRHVIARIKGDPKCVIFDHDYLNEEGARQDPVLKPGISKDLALEYDYIERAVALAPEYCVKTAQNGLDEEYPIRDLVLRLLTSGVETAKVDGVLFHLRRRSRPVDLEFTRRMIARLDLSATVCAEHDGVTVRYPIDGAPKVSIIVPFRDKAELLKACTYSIRRLTTWPNFEIILVDNASQEEETLRTLDELRRDQRVKIVPFNRPFNYSAANNHAVRFASGEYFIFLNNDTRVLTPDWIENLVGHAAREEVGAVGAKLYFSNGAIQHAGVVVGLNGLAGHLLAGIQEHTVDPMWCRHTRTVSAVTGACLAVSRRKFFQVGGFDERFELTGSDVDFCLRLRRLGLENVWTPRVKLFHYERETRKGVVVSENDKRLSLERYEPYLSDGDPYYNKELSRWSSRPIPRQLEERHPSWEYEDVIAEKDEETSSTIEATVLAYDADTEILERNRAHVAAFRASRQLRVKEAVWFVPAFDHIYRGGIYTIMRIADALSRLADTRNQFVLYGRHRDLEDLRTEICAAFPELAFDLSFLRSIDDADKLPKSDIGIATLWTSAYALVRYNRTRGKFYLVQDYEPAFQQAGSHYGLAEQTYRFGFAGIANTPGVASRYAAYGNDVIAFVPGVDRDRFFPEPRRTSPEDENRPVRIVFYGRPGNPRNGFELGVAALRRVKECFGSSVDIVSVGADYSERDYALQGVLTNLGVLGSLDAVAEQYRIADIGVVFMFTAHPSYQPFEFMASGCATVTNINEANTWLLRNGDNALVAPPTVSGVAGAISDLINDRKLRERIVEGGLSTVESMDWEPELKKVVHWIETGSE